MYATDGRKSTCPKIIGVSQSVKGPQEYDDGARQITWSTERQRDCEKSSKATRSLDFGGFFKGGVYGGEPCGKTKNNKRKHVQRLDEHQPVEPIDEIDRCLDQPRFHEEQIQSSMLAEKDDECKYTGIRGQNNRQKDEGCENCFSPVPISRQNVR